MTHVTFERTTPRRRTERYDRQTPETTVEPTREDVLSALDDADCREMLRALDDPQSAGDLVEECDIPSTTAYRKLDRLTDAGLIEEHTALREGFQQVTEYVRTFDEVRIVATEDGLAVEVEERERSPEDRLSTLWNAVGDET